MTRSDILRGKISSAIQHVRRWLFGMAFWRFCLLILGMSILQNGLWFSPLAAQYLVMSRSIIKNPFLAQTSMEWVLSSFLGPALAHLTSMNRSITSYCLLQFAIFLIGFPALVVAIRRQNGDFVARVVLIVFFLSPLPNILFTWLGTPDILTMLLSMAIVLFWRNPAPLLACSFLLGINHPEQGLVMLLLLSLFFFLTRPVRESLRFAMIGMGAALSGAVLLQWYLNSHDFDVVFTRADYIIDLGLLPFITSALHEPFALMFSLFNSLLLFIVVYLWYFGWKGRVAVAFALYCLLAFASILITLDQTRVFAVLTFPAVLLLVLSPQFRDLEAGEKGFFGTVLTISLLAGIFIPRFVVWNGSVSASAYGQILAFLHDHGALSLP